MFFRVAELFAAVLSSCWRKLVLAVKNEENSSLLSCDFKVMSAVLANLFDCCFSISKSFFGLFLALSSSDLKKSFFDCRILLLLEFLDFLSSLS